MSASTLVKTAMAEPHRRWFVRYPSRSACGVRLFCFPYAGGDGQVYRHWTSHLSPSIEVVGVEYPGRGRRFGEPLVSSVAEMVDALLPAIRPLLDRPFAFYGHSNGALVAYELSRRVQSLLLREPRALFLAAKRSPLLAPEKALHRLPDPAFIEILKDYDGTPGAVLQSPQLLDVYLPVLRADFALSETYLPGAPATSPTPCHLIAGSTDKVVTPSEIRGWASLFTGPVAHHVVEGGHFFLNSNPHGVARIVDRACSTTH